MEIDKKLQQNAVDYSMQTITHICKNIPPREPGSEAEKQAQEYLKTDILSNNWADTVVREEFPVAPKAFMSFSKIIPVLVALGIILFGLTVGGVAQLAWAPLVLCVLGLLTFFFEFGMYKQFLDPLFEKKTSGNLVATKKASVETRQRIVFSGHTDAAYEWTVFHHLGTAVYVSGLVLAIVGAIVTIVLSIVATVSGAKLWQLIVMLCFIPGYLSLFFYSNYKRVVPGANDNLTGCLAAISVLKYMKESGVDFKYTDVIAVCTGSEEAGLRGAKAWAKEHKAECDAIPTTFIGLETFRDIEHLANYVRDLTGTVKHNAEAIKLIDDAAVKCFGKALPHASVFLGASDAAAITQAGIKAGAIASMDPSPARYYHTRNDNEDNLSPECFDKGLTLTLTVLDLFTENENK